MLNAEIKQKILDADKVTTRYIKNNFKSLLDSCEVIAMTRHGTVDAYIIPEYLIRHVIETYDQQGKEQ